MISLTAVLSSIGWPDILVILMILAFFAVPAGIVLLILRIVKIRNRNSPTPPVATELGDRAKSYEGIGGWLILVAINLIRAPIAFCVTLLRSVFPLLRHDTWVALTTKGSEAYHPLWAPIIVSELIVNLTFLGAALVALVLFFRRKHLFPKFMIGLILATAIWEVLLGFVLKQIPDAGGDSTVFSGAIGLVLACAIWIPYFLVSKRVRATFTQ